MTASHTESVNELFEAYSQPVTGYHEVPRLWESQEDVATDLDGHFDEVMTVLVNGVRRYRFDQIRGPVQVLYDHLGNDPARRAALAGIWLIAAKRQRQHQQPLVDQPPLYEV